MLETLIYFSPLILTVVGNTAYNIVGKSTPQNANSFASLTITYVTGLTACIILFFITNPGGNLFEAISHANWASYALGIAIVLIDFSLILLFRAGWDISIGTLVANIGMALLTVLAGMAFFDEGMTMFKAFGVIACIIGLYVVNSPEKKKVADKSAEAASPTKESGAGQNA